MRKLYVGSKIIEAEPMDNVTFMKGKRPGVVGNLDGIAPRPGYMVVYPDGYVSWSPKETFETAYREVTAGEKDLFCNCQ